MSDEELAAGETLASPETGRTRPKWLVAVVAGGIALVVVAAGLAGSRALGIWGDNEPAASPEPSPAPTERVDPFAGTPAEDFAEGEAGIVLPEAEPIGDFTADEVAEALELVRDALIAARLDPAVLIDHDLEPLLSVMAPDQTAGMQAAIGASGYGPFPTMVAPGSVLVPEPPRVKGDFSYREIIVGPPDAPLLRVTTDFVWVYPFEGGLVVVRDALIWEVRLGRPWLESSRGLWLADGSAVAWGAECGRGATLRPNTDADLANDAIFDSERPLDAVPGC